MAAASGEASRPLPDGIVDEHTRPRGPKWANPIGLVVLALLVLAAPFGVYGAEHTLRASGGGIAATVHLPERLRSGEFFEIQIEVGATTAVDELAIRVSGSLWRDMTINTFIPAAADEQSQDGTYRFTFGPMDAGTTFNAKVDGQINPDLVGGTEGVISFHDGDRLLVELPVEIGLLP